MEYTVPQIALMIFGFALYFVKPSWLMLLWLIARPLLGPFIVLFSGVTDYEEQQSIVWATWGVFNRVFLLAILVELIKGHSFHKRITPLILPLGFILIYYVLHNVATHFYPLTILKEWIDIIFTLVPLFFLLLCKKAWPKLIQVYIVVLVICLTQLLFLPLNMQGIYAYSGIYQELLTGELDLMSGTFTRANMMADWLAIIYLFVTIDYFSRQKISLTHYIIVSVIILIPLISAGSKLPILITIINILLCIFIFKRDKILYVGVAGAFFLGLLLFLSSNQNIEISSNAGLNRFLGEMSQFVQSQKKGGGDDESTIKYSMDLLDRYYFSSPLVGHGNAYDDDENAYPPCLETALLKSDATLAFYLVEYGILGLSLFLWFQYVVVKLTAFSVPLKKRRAIVFVIFSFFFLMAVTEQGLFNKSNYIFVFIYMFGLARQNEQSIILPSLIVKKKS